MDNNSGKKRSSLTSENVPWKALVFSVVIFGMSLMIYAGLAFGYKTFLIQSTKEVENKISELDRIAPKKESEQNFIQFYSQVTNIQRLLSSHFSVAPFMDFLEANTLPDIAYGTGKISAMEKSAVFGGYAKSYRALANQLAVYENNPGIARIGLSNARFSDNVIRFEMKIDLAPDFFNFRSVQPKVTTQQPEENNIEQGNNIEIEQ